MNTERVGFGYFIHHKGEREAKSNPQFKEIRWMPRMQERDRGGNQSSGIIG